VVRVVNVGDQELEGEVEKRHLIPALAGAESTGGEWRVPGDGGGSTEAPQHHLHQACPARASRGHPLACTTTPLLVIRSSAEERRH
jgi:hypothetical protein